MTPINENTYENCMKSAQQAYLAADYIINNSKDQQNVLYVTASSPGHHAKYQEYGGYDMDNIADIVNNFLNSLIK